MALSDFCRCIIVLRGLQYRLAVEASEPGRMPQVRRNVNTFGSQTLENGLCFLEMIKVKNFFVTGPQQPLCFFQISQMSKMAMTAWAQKFIFKRLRVRTITQM